MNPNVATPLMRPVAILLGLLFCTTALAGCFGTSDVSCDADTATQASTGLAAEIVTTHGCIVVELFPDDAPRTVENFIAYAEDGFYEGTIFHRIVPGFVIQGGGFTESGTKKPTKAPIPLEAKRSNLQWTLSMARTQDPNSATSQFYVNLEDNSASLDPGAGGPGYAVFGQVIVGHDIVRTIADVETGDGPQPGLSDWPVEPPIIQAVHIIRGDRTAPIVEPTYGLEVGLIPDTQDAPGAWHTDISATTDHIPFWIRNTGNQPAKPSVTIDGPAHWDISMEPSTLSLGGAVGASFVGGRPTYEYVAHGLFVVDYIGEADAIAGLAEEEVTITFTHDSDASVQETLRIVLHPTHNLSRTVSERGSQVELEYRGTFDDGEEFDAGSFPTTLASGQTVPGFDFGLIGLTIGERVTIRFPPELGYGNDNAEGSRHARFNGEWLNFEVRITSIQ